MPTYGKEVYLTQVEIELMSIFVKHKVFNDLQIANMLRQLMNKLEGQYEKNTNDGNNRCTNC